MIEIYFRDLNKETQEKVLVEFRVKTPEEGNFDTIPLFTVENEDYNDDDDDEDFYKREDDDEDYDDDDCK